MTAIQGEFTVENAYRYNRRSAIRWIWSHVWRYKGLLVLTMCMYLVAWSMFATGRVLTGAAAEEITNPTGPDGLKMIALAVLTVLVLDGVSSLIGSLSVETIAQRLSR